MFASGESLTVFENKSKDTGDNTALDETVNDCVQCLDAICESFFPKNAANLQKCHMRGGVHKPCSVKTCEWLACV